MQQSLAHFPQNIQQQLLFIEKEYNNRENSWNIPREEGIFLNLLIKLQKPKIILEIGTSYGYSTLFLAEAAKKVNAKLITIDINPEKTKIARQNIEKAGLSEFVKFITDDANTAIQSLKEMPNFIFLDAKKTDYLFQFKYFEKHTQKSCRIAADNAIDLAKNMKDFLEYVANNKNLQTVLVPIGNGMQLSIID
ncbi:TPA: DUF1442 domain-containing protein [Candidatus Woesearchaeota archaeon]|nr:DUF1442 domain-containing protein [Candidatus Woesearchaeota archaeon]